jgi:hypothetical protein
MDKKSSKGLTGWLRKRPRFPGHWPMRFVTLSEDGKLDVYAREPQTASPNELTVALLAVYIPKNIAVSEPFEKLVRIKRNGPKREKVVAIRVQFKNQALFTFGLTSMDEAQKWRQAILAASRTSQAPDELVVKDEDEETGETDKVIDVKKLLKENRRSFIPEGWRSADENWQVVEEQDGLQIEGQKELSTFPILRARLEFKCKPDEVFALLMDDNRRSTWDDGILTSAVLKDLNDQSAVVYIKTKEMWIGPIYSGPRDMVLLRYWRKDEEAGDYVITWQSLEDATLAPPAEGFTRGKIFSMGIGISSYSNEPGTSLLRISCHADPGGTLSYLPTNILQKWLSQFVTRIIGIQKSLDDEKTIALEKDEEEDEKNVLPKAILSPANSSGIYEINRLKIGSWNHSEWMETPVEEPFKIRGKTYLTDRIKISSEKHMFHIVAADLNKTKEPVPHCAARSDSPLKKIQSDYPDRQVFVLQFIMPGPPFYMLAVYGVSKPGVCEEDTPFSRLWNDFVDGTDEYRNTVLKLIPRVTNGAYIVKKTVGETPAILGQKVKLNYYTGANYIEVDVDLNTSAVAGSILSIFKGYATTLTADLSILLEGHSEDELPEEIMMSFRMVKPVLAKAIPLGDDPSPEETVRLQRMSEKARRGEVKKCEQ